jgi:soluble lytic murein transglycosylase
LARRHALPRPRREDLFTPARNVALGSRYLLERRERYGGHWLPAFAAYNAGAGNVDRWLPAAPMAADVWVENIPFNETREYVGKLLWHQTVFAWLASGQPQRVESFLGPVQRPPAP